MLRLTQAGAKLLPACSGSCRRSSSLRAGRPERPDLRKLAEMAQIDITDAEVVIAISVTEPVTAPLHSTHTRWC